MTKQSFSFKGKKFIQILKQRLNLLKKKVLICKEELFVKNIELNDLEEMEDVAEIAVNRCRNRLMYLQNRIERRREMLEKVRNSLTKFERDTIKVDLENNISMLDLRKLELGENISAIKISQRNFDEKMQGLLFSLEGHGARLVAMNKTLDEEKRRLFNIKQEVNVI